MHPKDSTPAQMNFMTTVIDTPISHDRLHKAAESYIKNTPIHFYGNDILKIIENIILPRFGVKMAAEPDFMPYE